MDRLDYSDVLAKYFPHGKCFSGQNFKILLDGISQEFGRVHSYFEGIFKNEIPGAIKEKFGPWEKLLQISGGENETIEVRNANIVAKLSAVGGQSDEFWSHYLRRISTSEIELENFEPLSVGFSVGATLYGQEWIFTTNVKNVKKKDLAVIKANLERFRQSHLACVYEVIDAES